MSIRPLLFALAALLAATRAAAAPPVEVEFLHPEKFTDAVYGRERPRRAEDNSVLGQLRGYLEKQAPRHLGPGQQLRIRFTDIDLAGDREPLLDPDLHDVRIVRSIYPPRLAFDFQLRSADGLVLREASVDLRDLAFDLNPPMNGNDPLRFEKRMLKTWLRQTFEPAR